MVRNQFLLFSRDFPSKVLVHRDCHEDKPWYTKHILGLSIVCPAKKMCGRLVIQGILFYLWFHGNPFYLSFVVVYKLKIKISTSMDWSIYTALCWKRHNSLHGLILPTFYLGPPECLFQNQFLLSFLDLPSTFLVHRHYFLDKHCGQGCNRHNLGHSQNHGCHVKWDTLFLIWCEDKFCFSFVTCKWFSGNFVLAWCLQFENVTELHTANEWRKIDLARL